MHVKKGDTVIVISGNDKGRTGEILRVFTKKGRVLVSGVNMRWRHKRPTQQSPKGERVQEESSIHASNVMFFDADQGKGVRKRPTQAEATE